MPKTRTPSSIQLKQKVGSWGKVAFTLEPGFVDFKAESSTDGNVSFRAPYSLLPAPRDYFSYRPPEQAAFLVFILIPICCLIFVYVEGPSLFVPMYFGPLFLAGSAYTILRARQRNPCRFTCLMTEKGTLLVWQNGQHDEIIAELEQRRLAALKDMDRIDPLADMASEIGKFRYLLDEGILTAEQFEQRCAQLSDLKFDEEVLDPIFARPAVTQ